MNRILTLSILIFFGLFTYSQNSNKDTTQVSFDKKFKIGFTISFGNSFTKLNVNSISNSIYSDSLNGISKRNSPYNFQGGLIYERKLTNTFSFRTMFVACFETISLTYNKKSETEKLDLPFFGFNIPLNIMAHTKGAKTQAYLVAGPKLNFGIGPDQLTKDKVNTKQFDIVGEVGVGIHRKFKKIFVSPEIRFSQGLLNLKGNNNNLYTEPLQGFYRQCLWLTLNVTGN